MKFHIGAVPQTPNFSPDGTWRALHEPVPWAVQLLALPIGIASGALAAAMWFFFTPLENLPFDSPGIMLAVFVAIVPIHEFIHAAVHPQSGKSDASILGVWPSRLMFYAHYTGELSRTRFIAIAVMPLFIISTVPLIVCAVTDWSSSWLALASALNALCACGDILGIGVLLFQVPADATVRNQGWRTFWKPAG
jgi:hypothetical protein